MCKHDEYGRVSVKAELQLIQWLALETRIEEKAREHLWTLIPAVYGSTALSITVEDGSSIKAMKHLNLQNAQSTTSMIELLQKHHIVFVHIDISPVRPTRRLACLHATQGAKFSQPLGCTAASLSYHLREKRANATILHNRLATPKDIAIAKLLRSFPLQGTAYHRYAPLSGTKTDGRMHGERSR